MTSSRKTAGQYALSLLAGVLVALSMPPWGWWPLAFVGLALFTSLELNSATARQRFATGFTFGIGWFFPALSWMWFLTAPGYVVGALMYAGLHGLASLVVARRDNNKSFLFLSPATHMAIEVARLSLPFGGVPLATLGISQVGGPLRNVASVGGVILLSWLTWQIGALLARGPRNFAVDDRHRRFITIICLVAVVGAQFAPNGSDTGRDFHVAAIQGGGPQGTRAIDTDPRDVVERHLKATRTIEADSSDPFDLVVWPENVIDVLEFGSSIEAVEVAAEAKRLGAPFAVGITEDVDRRQFTNAQVIIDDQVDIIDRYDKVRRVPFGEYMPLRSFLESLGAPVDQVPRDAMAGSGPAILDVPHADGDQRIGVVISWEVFFGGRAREGVKRGAGFIINPTNGSSYTWTVLQSQQIASSKLRAIETGRWVVQISPTGFSAFVDPQGRVYDRTSVSEESVISRHIAVRSGRTIYVVLGDSPWIALLALVFLLAILNRSSSRTTRSVASRSKR